ncbi:MAG TPA: heterodisulfide reductase-related iron-sulfur binding cluster, partial [Mycobacteriales bacterium]|nr:heterodisulfide reductase-related iron-sulfur binding cluster [Mycobacteriales bacterium]
DCPVKVDMASYKAEFLHHYYRRRIRPRQAYALGLIPVWARLASRMPRLANLATHAPGLSRLVKRAGGVALEREAPRFATTTFRAWFDAHPPRHPEGERVLLWPDTFVNYFDPDVGVATVEVLEAAGFRVDLPRDGLCCGRPLYDYGMLTLAKRYLRRILDAMRDDIRAGVAVVGMEPSCLAVFRDELVNLFPDDADAQRLAAQSVVLSEFLTSRAPGLDLPQLDRKALVQGHCHHRSVMGFDDEEQILVGLGLDLELPDSGCCGMAGSFGYEAGERYDVSVAAGERVLLPAIRDSSPDTLVVADGFSCRSQIKGGTDRRPMHLAQVIALAYRGRRPTPVQPAPTPEGTSHE